MSNIIVNLPDGATVVIVTVGDDVWADPDDAATVRFHANGSEKVPTVVIGEVGLVNPTAKQVAEHLEQFAPHLLPDGYERPQPSLLGRLLGN
jgi:hypothetical protein